jgi:hypothetical protein
LHVNDGSWQGLGGYVREIAAPAFSIGLPGDVVYAVGENQGGFLNKKAIWFSLGGYLQG